MLCGDEIEWAYMINLDNRAFTINAWIHLKLDNMPPMDEIVKYNSAPT